MSKIKMIAIPFAGGNKYSYDRFNSFLPSNFLLKTVEYPGRGDRFDADSLTDVKALAADALDQIRDDIQQGEYIIYGHSLGALVGYELVKEIQKTRYPLPSCLFVTGHGAPSIPERDPIASYPSDKFWQKVTDLGGMPAEVLASKETLEFLEPILRSDFQAAETYDYQPMKERFRIPIYALSGSDEDVTKEELETWQDETESPLQSEILSGDHFFIFDHTKKILQQIVDAHDRSIKKL